MSAEETTEQRKARLAALRQAKQGAAAAPAAPPASAPATTAHPAAPAALGDKRKATGQAAAEEAQDERVFDGEDEIVAVEDLAEAPDTYVMLSALAVSVRVCDSLSLSLAAYSHCLISP